MLNDAVHRFFVVVWALFLFGYFGYMLYKIGRRQVLKVAARHSKNSEIYFKLGCVYLKNADTKKARRWLYKAAQSGQGAAYMLLGDFYWVEGEPDRFFNLAVACWRRAINAGVKSCQLRMALAYYIGSGVSRDFVQAKAYLECAIAEEDALAVYEKGLWYLEGLAFPRDVDKGLALIRQAAEIDVPAAVFFMARAYDKGDLVAENKALARSLRKRARVLKFNKGAEGVRRAGLSLRQQVFK